MASSTPPGSLVPTPRRTLAVAALFGGLGGWLVYVVAGALEASPPAIPWTTPAAISVAAAVIAVLAYLTHQRIQVRHERVEPQRAVGYLVLGKAAALAGAVVAGGYLAYGIANVFRLEAAAPRDRAVKSLVCVLAGIGLCVAGLLLERACRVPRSDDDDAEPDGESTPG